MEWLRSCYASFWHLFRDNPAVRTKGRYYKPPADTPFYGGAHNLGSRTWNDTNWQAGVVLGEDLGTPHQWYSGLAPAVLPHSDRIVGSADCIAQGELTTDVATDLDQGFPRGCYSPAVPLDPTFNRAAEITACQVQLFYAQVIDLLENDQSANAVFATQQFFGAGAAVTFHPRTGQYPGCINVIAPSYAVSIVEATHSYQQLALQAFYGLAGPTNIGIYKTNSLWYAASQQIFNYLSADGINPGCPLMLAGHSYGGATVLNMAGRYRHAFPTQIVRYLTYGAPKPGDIRLRALLESCNGIALANTQDFVTILPPSFDLLTPILVIIPIPGLSAFGDWQASPSTTLQLPSGRLLPNVEPNIDTGTLLVFIQQALAHQSLFGMPTHTIGEYQRRIALRCYGPPTPPVGQLRMTDVFRHFPKLIFGVHEVPVGKVRWQEPLQLRLILDETSGYVLMEDGTPILLE